MIDSIDDIIRQARQGSVAAIIQILNERLSTSGVRTRAVLAHGVLQLLCEAASPHSLERPKLVSRIRQTLESIQPRHIRRVKINSRIVREQQLLWLEEITRDPDNQLLWSEEITLKRPNPLRRFAEDFRGTRPEASKVVLPKSQGRFDRRENRLFWRATLGGAALSLGLIALGWLIYDRLGVRISGTSQAQMADENAADEKLPGEEALDPSATSPSVATAQTDPFVQAVRIAEQAAIDGQKAQSLTEWLDLAARWQRASDLMAEIHPDDNRFVTAQNRRMIYQQNSDAALQQAESLRSPTPPVTPEG